MSFTILGCGQEDLCTTGVKTGTWPALATVNKAQLSLYKAYRMLVTISKQGWLGKASVFTMPW
jgi:hypothetical protein